MERNEAKDGVRCSWMKPSVFLTETCTMACIRVRTDDKKDEKGCL